MTKDKFPESQILSVGQFLDSYETGCRNGERFCFILGSGASVDSGIPMGSAMENRWMACLMGEEKDQDGTEARSPEETRKLAALLREEGKLQHDFSEIEESWKKIKKSGKGTMPSKYYFDLYKIRFSPNHRNGYYYLEKLMADKEPSFGYHTLAELLTDDRGNNLVITTNFDNLMEDALFLFGNRKPLVINHELLSEYIGNHNIKRPIIAKIHRGMFFDPLNDPENTTGLKGRWHEILQQAFHIYTPVVIGYGGGDHSLMEFLADEKTDMPNGIYWCYVEKFGLPDPDIQKLVKDNKGWFVRTDGFDSIMLKMGMKLFPDRIGAHETEEYLKRRTNERIARYNESIGLLMEREESKGSANKAQKEYQAVVNDFRKQEEKSQEEREKGKKMTAWDYERKGIELFKQGEYVKAVEMGTKAIELQDDVAIFYYNRGLFYYKLQNYEKALADSDYSAKLDPQYKNAYILKAHIYREMKKYAEETEICTKVLEMDAQNKEAYLERGISFKKQEKYDKALEDYNAALKLDPNYASAYNSRGNIYDIWGDYGKAIEDYKKALELDPKDKVAAKNRDRVQKKVENLNKEAAATLAE